MPGAAQPGRSRRPTARQRAASAAFERAYAAASKPTGHPPPRWMDDPTQLPKKPPGQRVRT